MGNFEIEFHNFDQVESNFKAQSQVCVIRALRKAFSRLDTDVNFSDCGSHESSSRQLINVVFVGIDEIRSLNQKYRNKEEATDVLSFGGLDESLAGFVPKGGGDDTRTSVRNIPTYDSENIIGEVYICPKYLKINENQFQEVLRLVIHGILHVMGYDHAEYFRESSCDNEEMFIIQERILSEVVEELEI